MSIMVGVGRGAQEGVLVKNAEALHKDVCLDDLSSSCITQESITEKVNDESGSQRWYPVEEPEWKRIRNYTAEGLELFLHLTPEQKDVLESPPPVLVSGTAGSGKTTLAVYYLLRRDLQRWKNVFISFNRHLKLFAERLYRGLLNEAEGRSEVVGSRFWVFREFLLETARRAGRPIDPDKEVNFRRFEELYASHPLRQKFDPVLVWEEIRSILKGALPQVDTTVLERSLRTVRNREPETSIFSRLQQQFLLFSNLESLKAVPRFVENISRRISLFLRPEWINNLLDGCLARREYFRALIRFAALEDHRGWPSAISG